MSTKPKHYAVFILNENGSGTVKQFDTWQEAKAAYAAESVTGKAVYLYPQPMKSIGAGSTPIEAPAKVPITFTAVQNTGEFTWPPTPPLPRPTSPGGPFNPNYYGDWAAYCLLYPTHRECTIPGKPKFGTESLACAPGGFGWRSTDGTEYPSSRPTIQIADGLGGTFPSGEEWTPEEGLPFRKWYAPCEYPNGFREYQNFTATANKQLIFGTLSGSTVIPINRLALIRGTRNLVQYSGNVASLITTENGVLPRDIPTFERELEVNALREYEAGEPVFNFQFGDAAMSVYVLFPLKPANDDNSEPLAPITELVEIVVTETGNTHNIGSRTADVFRSGVVTPSPDGPRNLSYDAEAGIGSGYWDVTMASPTTLTFTFTPSGDTPADARPPEGWAGTVSLDASGEPDGVDTTGVPPGGTHQGPWVYDYDAANILLESDFDNHYYTNGTGSYYAIAIPPTDCDPADTLVNENATEPITYDAGCGEWEIGTLTYNVYADGNCSFYDTTVGSDYDVGVIGTCNGNTYSVDSSGTVTSEPIISGYEGEEAYITIPTGASVLSGTRVRPQYASGGVGEWTPWNYTTSGTLYGSDASNDYYADGAGSYTSEPVTPPCDLSGTDLGVDPNDSCNNLYADGNCGTYSNSNGSCPTCDPSGTDLGVDPNDSCNNIYADGNCGTYTSDNGSCPACDPPDAFLGSGSEPTYYNSDCGPMQNGYIEYNDYADGSCGTYRTWLMTTYYGSGTFIGECGDYFYSDGSGGAYTA